MGTTGMRHAIFTGAVLVLFCSTPATPAGPATVPLRRREPAPGASPTRRSPRRALYSRRSRRLVQSYLRLKLLEMREADLERARKSSSENSGFARCSAKLRHRTPGSSGTLVSWGAL